MPENATIGLIVLGGVLLLVALVGGKFKIFGAEIESTPSKLSRFAAFVIGLICLLVGIGNESETPKQREEPPVAVSPTTPPPATPLAASDSGTTAPTVAAPVPVTAVTDAPSVPLPNLAGLWHDGNGTGVQIVQQGARLHFEAANLISGQLVVGEGVLRGRQIELTTTTNTGLVATGTGVVGVGDAVMNFTMRDAVNGSYTFGLARMP